MAVLEGLAGRLLFRREFGLACAANRANPFFGELFKSRSGGNAVLRVSEGGVIDIPANAAYVFFHLVSFLLA